MGEEDFVREGNHLCCGNLRYGGLKRFGNSINTFFLFAVSWQLDYIQMVQDPRYSVVGFLKVNKDWY